MSKALIGSARIGESGSWNQVAGDQLNGKEVSVQNWYLHSKGWRVFRCVDEYRAKRIADCMLSACDSMQIGYDQKDRLSLYDAIKDKGFEIGELDKSVETDCSALVRVCLAYAGIDVPNFTTANEAKVIMDSGLFSELLADRYTKTDKELKEGDILVTRTQGHTVVVVKGSVETTDCPYKEPILTVKRGTKGASAKWVQWHLCKCGYTVAIDGSFGADSTEKLLAFQKSYWKNDATMWDSKCGKLTRNALKKSL